MTTPPDWIRVNLESGGSMRVRVSSIDVFLPSEDGKGTKLLIRGGPWISVDRDFADALDRALGLGKDKWENL